MQIFQAYCISFWFTLLCLAGNAVSQKADCSEGLLFDAQQGDPFTFSIPLNKTCSAALATFSDGTDLMLDLGVSSACNRSSLDSQAFTAVIGSDASEGIATLNFQCGGETYCMSLNIALSNTSESNTTLRSVCFNSTQVMDGSRRPDGKQSSLTKGTTTGDSIQATKPTTLASLAETGASSNSSPFAMYPGASNGYSNMGNVSAASTAVQASSKNEMSGSIPAYQTSSRPSDDDASMITPSVTTSPSDSSMLNYHSATWSTDGTESLASPSTTQHGAIPLSTLSTVQSSGRDNLSASDHSTMLPATQPSLGFPTSLTTALGQDPSTCACFPRSSN